MKKRLQNRLVTIFLKQSVSDKNMYILKTGTTSEQYFQEQSRHLKFCESAFWILNELQFQIHQCITGVSAVSQSHQKRHAVENVIHLLSLLVFPHQTSYPNIMKNILSSQNIFQNFQNGNVLECRTGKMLGCFNPILGQIWTNPAIGLHF